MAFQNPTLRLSILTAVMWTVVLALSLVWNLHQVSNQAMSMAYAEARANLNKDITFRRWARITAVSMCRSPKPRNRSPGCRMCRVAM